LTRSHGNAAMHRVKHPPLRNKINLAEPAQVRAWTRRLGVSADVLKVVVERVGNSVAAVTKEFELQRAANQTPRQPAEAPAIPLAEGELSAPV
jgi:hypothetical protein